MLYFVFQYPGKFCDNDSIFAATLNQLGDAPPPYTPRDLRRDLCKHLADSRDYIYVSKNTNSFFSFLYLYLEFNIIITKHTQFPYNSNHYNFYFQPLLKPLTEREAYSYKKIVENLQKGLFIPYTIIAKALRLFTNIPSVYYKCKTISSSSETTKSKKEVKTFKLHATWPVTTDQDLSHLKEHLGYFNNGRDYIISIKPQALCEVNESKNNLIETLIESQNYLKTLKEIVPKSEVKSTLNQHHYST